MNEHNDGVIPTFCHYNSITVLHIMTTFESDFWENWRVSFFSMDFTIACSWSADVSRSRESWLFICVIKISALPIHIKYQKNEKQFTFSYYGMPFILILRNLRKLLSEYAIDSRVLFENKKQLLFIKKELWTFWISSNARSSFDSTFCTEMFAFQVHIIKNWEWLLAVELFS